MGDYAEIEEWIREGRVDCGFLRLPTSSEFDVISLHQDQLMAVIPEDHPYAEAESGLGISILPELILKRMTYKVVVYNQYLG